MVMNMLKRLSLYTLLLCLVPLFVWLFAWQWNGNIVFESYEHPLYWLTESGSVPYAIITCGVFALLFLPLFSNRKQWILAVAVMAFSMVITQGVKSGLKNAFSEPRPFVTYVTEQTGSSADAFYAQDRQARAQIVDQFYQTQRNVQMDQGALCCRSWVFFSFRSYHFCCQLAHVGGGLYAINR